MNKVISLALIALLAIPSSAFTQNLKDQVPTPKTELEEFSAKTGAVIIRGFEKTGTLQGMYSTSVAVEAKEFINASSGKRKYGVTIQVENIDGRYEKKNTSYIDYDEIESLLDGIDYISQIDKTATKLTDFQADYKTKGDFSISTFSSGDKTMVAVSSGNIGKATAYFNLSSLPEIRQMIQTTKAKIDALKK